MLLRLCLGLNLLSPSPNTYFVDLAQGTWKQLNGKVHLEFYGDGSAKVWNPAYTILPEIGIKGGDPTHFLPQPVWKKHRWNWKGSSIVEANWEWQLLNDTIVLPAHWMGGKKGESWTFVQTSSPNFFVPPAPDPNLVKSDQSNWKRKLKNATAKNQAKSICKALNQVNFPDAELEALLKEDNKGSTCLKPHAHLRLALMRGYSREKIVEILNQKDTPWKAN